MDFRHLLVAIFLCLPAGAAPPSGPTSKILYHDKLALKQLVTPEFQQLPVERRIFVSYLADAIEAGRDIAWIQQGAYGLSIRHIFERIFAEPEKLYLGERNSLEHYYFRLLSAHGVYDRETNEKFVLEGITPSEFASILMRFKIPTQPANIWRAIFEKDFQRYAIAPRDQDLIANSGVNFYGPGMNQVRLSMLEPAEQRHFLSYPRWDSVQHKSVMSFHRLGDRFNDQLEKVDQALEKAEPFANEIEKKIIELSRKVIRSANPEDQDELERLWVQNRTKDIVFNIGFTETYDDPLETRGTWEGWILLLNKDTESERRSAQIKASAVDFEKRMPVAEEFKKTGEFSPPDYEGAYLLYAGGGNTEAFFTGVNLPNSSEIREALGSRSFMAINKAADIGQMPGEDFLPGEIETFYRPEYHEALLKFGKSLPYMVQVEFHEVLGHGSGRDREGVDSKKALGSYFATMEEARAELAALYHLTDIEALEKHKIFPSFWNREAIEQFSQAVLVEFFTKHILSLERLRDAGEIRQAHQLGRQIIFNQMLERKAIEIHTSRTGIPQVVLANLDDVRRGLGQIWRFIQRLKGTGNVQILEHFTHEHGRMTEQQRSWLPEISKAFKAIKWPEYTLYMVPKIKRITNSEGEIVDVVQDYVPSGGRLSKLFEHEQKRRCEDLVL